MYKLIKSLFLGIVTITLLDTIGSVTSRRFGYEYTSLVYGSYIIYGLIDRKKTSLNIRTTFLVIFYKLELNIP